METSPSASPRATAVTIGNFDGVHQGHQVLIRRALTYSQQFGLDCVVITFWPHPRVLFGKPHQPLTSRAARMRLLQGLGDLRVLELPFTHELAALSPEEFVRQHLLPLRLKHLVIGHDFTLGRGRSGQPDVLRSLGAGGSGRACGQLHLPARAHRQGRRGHGRQPAGPCLRL